MRRTTFLLLALVVLCRTASADARPNIVFIFTDDQAPFAVAAAGDERFITHNIDVVRYFADEVAVMYQGRIVEQGSVAAVCDRPQHPYTRKLLAAVPSFDPPPDGSREAAPRS